MAKLTLKTARAQVKALGATLQPDGCGEYVVTLDGAEYYTPDLEDAVGTASFMAVERAAGKTVKVTLELATHTETVRVSAEQAAPVIAWFVELLAAPPAPMASERAAGKTLGVKS